MFNQTFVGGGNTTRKTTSLILSLLFQTALSGVAVLIPLIYAEALPIARLTSALVEPPPPPPPPRQSTQVRTAKPVLRTFHDNQLMAPGQIPVLVPQITSDEMPAVAGTVPGGVAVGTSNSLQGVVGSFGTPAPPPAQSPEQEPPKEQTKVRIHVGGNVQAARLIAQPKPQYPGLARQARIQGAVRFSAVIGKDGTIQNLELVSGHPLLVAAATEAVRQWRYRPTLLNNEPVEVVTQIDVNFTLSQ